MSPILAKEPLTNEKLIGIACGLETTIVWTESKIFTAGQLSVENGFKMVELFDKNHKIIQVSSGARHVLVLVEKVTDGEHILYSLGQNNYGQLGVKSVPTSSNKLVIVNFPSTVKKFRQISCGAYHSLVLTEDRKLYVFGYNYYGQCLNGNTSANIFQPTMIDVDQIVGNKFSINFICGGGSDTILLSEEGHVFAKGRNCPKKAGILDIKSKIVYATSGFQHSFVVSDKGRVYGWGSSSFGELGVEKTVEAPILLTNLEGKFISKICSGHYHVIALTMDVPPIEISPSTLGRELRSLLQSSNFSDLTLQVEMSTMKVHKCVLAGTSNVFRNLCNSSENPKVIKEDPVIFRHLLEFVYSGRVEVEKNNLKSLQEISKKFQVDSLTSLCEPMKNPTDTEDLSWNPVDTMYDNKEYSDIVLEAETTSFYAHKAVLSVRSEKYRALFESGMIESRQSKLIVDQVPSHIFSLLLKYIYRDGVTLESDNAVDVLVCATEYMMPRLIELCEDFLKSGITLENVCEVWKLSEEFGANQLWKFCKFFIELEIEKVKQTEGYKQLSGTIKEQLDIKRK